MEVLPFLIFPMLLVIAGLYDLTTMTIPNWISGVLIVAYLILAPAIGLPWSDIGLSFGNAIGVLLLGMVAFAFGVFGGGDAKLLAAGALWFGFPLAWMFILLTMAFGGAAALILISFRKIPLPQPVNSVDWVIRLHRGGEPLPYGTAIAAAGLVVMFEAPLMKLLF